MPFRNLSVCLLAIAVLSIAAVALPIASAGSAPKQGKDYTVVVATAFAGDTVDYTVTITNKAGTQELGSANLTIPDAIGLGPDGSVSASVTPRGTATPSETDARVIELRDLALVNDEPAIVTIQGLEMPCVGNPVWEVPPAKQSNDFSALPGNALTFNATESDLITDLGGQCELTFAAEPANAQQGAAIRSAAFDPVDGPPVQVGALDANGGEPVRRFDEPVAIGHFGTGGGTLSKDPADPADDGALLSYSGLSIGAAGTYKLTAAKDGYVDGVSSAFAIAEVVEDCDHASCLAKLDGTRASTVLQGALAGGPAGHAVLSRSTGTRPECPGYVSPLGTAEWYEFALTVAREKTMTVTYSKNAMRSVAGGAPSLEICLSSPEPFVAKGGTRLFNYDDLDGDPLDGFVGLLANCGDVPAGEPCIRDRAPASGGRAVVTFFVPARLGDPRQG